MLNLKEISYVIAISLIISFIISLVQGFNIFLYSLAFMFIVIIINILAKKIAAYYLDSEININLWEMRRWGFKSHHYFKKPFPIGAFLPIIIAVISAGYVWWMACLNFEVKPKVYRAAKRWGLYTFSEMTEWHIGIIAAVGILANLLLAIIGYLLGVPDFARLNIYFAFFNMLPLSSLDGNKIFFGSLVLWSFLAILILIGLGYAFLLI